VANLVGTADLECVAKAPSREKVQFRDDVSQVKRLAGAIRQLYLN
jgi:hypothetical protein